MRRRRFRRTERAGMGVLLVALLLTVGLFRDTGPTWGQSPLATGSPAPGLGPSNLSAAAAVPDEGSLLVNGSFETGDFTGWSVEDVGSGGWQVVRAGGEFSSGASIPTPTDGSFQAVLDQAGPGAHLLYQDVELPADSECALSFDLAVQNAASDFVDGGSLDPNAGPNQQVRVDVLAPPPEDPFLYAGSGVRTLFATEPGSGNFEYRHFQFDLSELAGQRVRIRFAEVDNQLFLNVSVDNVAWVCKATFLVDEVPLDTREESPSWRLGAPWADTVPAGSFTQGTVVETKADGTTEEREALREYSVRIPEEGAQILAVFLESQDGGNLDLYARASRPIEIRTLPQGVRVQSDFAALSPGGVEILVISHPEPEITYWFIVENPESFDQRFEITAWLLPEIHDGSAGADGQVGVPANLPAPLARYLQTDQGLLGLQQYRIKVPKGAKRLQVELEGEGDLNLHLRFGEPVAIDEETGQVVADVSAVSPSGSEALVLAGNLLQEGSYYLAVEGLSPPQEFLLTITLITPEGMSAITLGGKTKTSSTPDGVELIEF